MILKYLVFKHYSSASFFIPSWHRFKINARRPVHSRWYYLIIALITDETDVALEASDLWLGTRTGAGGTGTLTYRIFLAKLVAPWLTGHQFHFSIEICFLKFFVSHKTPLAETSKLLIDKKRSSNHSSIKQFNGLWKLKVQWCFYKSFPIISVLISFMIKPN